MAHVYEFDGLIPVIDSTAFVHPEASLIGDVIIGPECFVGPFASLRGDFGRIVLETGVNVQDSCTLHAAPGANMHVETDGHVGHGAILHGCCVGRGALIGMNAVVLDGANIGEFAFVGASAFVKAGFQLPAGHLAAGNPAKVMREVSEKELKWKAGGTKLYQQLAQRSLRKLKPATALPKPEENRSVITWEGWENESA